MTPAEGVATASVAPSAASAAPIVSTNPRIAGQIGANPTFLAMGELGGEFTVGALGAVSYTTSFELKVALTSAGLSKDLVVSFYNPTSLGNGPSAMSIQIQANSITVPTNGTFTDPVAFLTDKPFNCGTLGVLAPTSGALDLTVTMQTTYALPGDGFFAGVLVTG
jgi:hypothetical protein